MLATIVLFHQWSGDWKADDIKSCDRTAEDRCDNWGQGDSPGGYGKKFTIQHWRP